MICGTWNFYIEIPRNHFFTTVSNTKRTYRKDMKIPRKKILTQFPEITFFRPFNKYHDIMLLGVASFRYLPLCLR